MSWQPISTCPQDRLVMTKIDDAKGVRNEQKLKRSGHLFFSGDSYVYYEPTHWRELTDIEKLRHKNEAERLAIDAMDRAHRELG